MLMKEPLAAWCTKRWSRRDDADEAMESALGKSRNYSSSTGMTSCKKVLQKYAPYLAQHVFELVQAMLFFCGSSASL